MKFQQYQLEENRYGKYFTLETIKKLLVGNGFQLCQALLRKDVTMKNHFIDCWNT